MDALIPKLFIFSVEVSIVLFIILIVILALNNKIKRKDINASRKMVIDYVSNKDERVSDLKSQLDKIGFSGNADEQANQFYDQEKSLIKEFISLYLQHDTIRLLNYSKNIIKLDNNFLSVSGSAKNIEHDDPIKDTSEENANATILAREQAESNDKQLKELSELRLKNTELNEHLFEALETITELMTEHGKKTGQEIATNSQKVLEAIIYLRDKRLGKVATDIEEDATLDDSTIVNLGIKDDLETEIPTEDEADPWAEALSEQADAETKEKSIEDLPAEPAEPETPEANEDEEDPWATALSEQDAAEENTDIEEIEPERSTEDDDPWADALAEQAIAEAAEDEQETEEDPWADALAEQAASDAEEDPWAEALAEQNESENKS